MIRCWKAQRRRRTGQAFEVPPYSERAPFVHFERLEHPVANDEAMIDTGNRGLLWILVEAAVQPDPELGGQTLRSGCGELHPVRLSA